MSDDDLIQEMLIEIAQELKSARQKYPAENNFTTLALAGEVGELVHAIAREDAVCIKAEAIQVAVMALRLCIDGDPSVMAWRKSQGLGSVTISVDSD